MLHRRTTVGGWQLIFDLVFIDDWHAYEHVKTELQLLEERMTALALFAL